MFARVGLGLSLEPLVDDIASCLLKCGAAHNRADVLCLHAHICGLGVEAYPAVGNHLVFQMAEVGSFCYAEQVFSRLVCRNEYSWNSLITASVKCCNPHLALELYHKMQENGFQMTTFAFIALLKACAAVKDLEKGSELHDLIITGGVLEMDACIGSTLVDMYVKCGALTKARDLLAKLMVRDVVTWTALISGYADYGCGDETFTLIEKMQLEGISPNAYTLVCSLKACCATMDLEKGKEVHADIVRKGFEGDLLVGNTLIDMYAKCGTLETAQFVFEKLPSQTPASWTVLIEGYTQHSNAEEALSIFHQMQQQKVSPDALTFVCSLKACGGLREATEGMLFHAEIVAKGLDSELFIGSAIVDMYAKCGFLEEAYEAFEKVQNKDVILWTALIAGYIEHGCDMEAFACLQSMQSNGVPPNTVTFVSALQACSHIATIFKGREVHTEITIKGLEEEFIIGSSLVEMYAKCGQLTEVQHVFNKFPAQQAVLWSSVLAAYAERGHDEETLNCFVEMENGGIPPTAVAIVFSLKACANAGFLSTGLRLHAEIVKKGFEGNRLVGNTLVDMYIKFSFLVTAKHVFDRLPAQDVISWNALIKGYVDNDHGEEALCSLGRMRCEGIVCMDMVTYVCSLKACGSTGASLMGQEIHAEIIKKGLEKVPLVGNASMDMYAKCGLIAEAQKAFDRLLDQDVISWNTLISAYAQLGKSKHVFNIVDRMVGEGVKPNTATLIGVVNACSHAGSVIEGLVLFEAFDNPDFGIVPTLEHYNCLIDLLGRAGHFEKVAVMITEMPLHPDHVVWYTVLGSCRNWGNVVLGRHAFDHALELKAKTAALYLCMCSIYLQAALPEDAKKVEQMRE